MSADGTTAETVIELAHGTSTTAYRARTALAIAKQNGDVLVVWSAAGAGAPDLKSVLIQAGGQLSPIHVAEAAGVEPIHVMADGDGYTLAILVPGQEGRFSVSSIQLRSDGTFGHRSSTSVDVGSWRTAAASKGGVILLTYNPASSIASRVTSVALTSNGSATTPEILAIARARQFRREIVLTSRLPISSSISPKRIFHWSNACQHRRRNTD